MQRFIGLTRLNEISVEIVFCGSALLVAQKRPCTIARNEEIRKHVQGRAHAVSLRLRSPRPGPTNSSTFLESQRPSKVQLAHSLCSITLCRGWAARRAQSDRRSSEPFRSRLLSDPGERCGLRTAASVVGHSEHAFTRSRGSWLELQADRATPSSS